MSKRTRDLTELEDLMRDREGLPVVGDGRYLIVSEVVVLLREAGYSDSDSTVRRMCDDGTLESYRLSEKGHRRILAASVRELIEKRRPKHGGANPSPPA